MSETQTFNATFQRNKHHQLNAKFQPSIKDIRIKRYEWLKNAFDNCKSSFTQSHPEICDIYDLIYQMGGERLTSQVSQRYFSQHPDHLTPQTAQKQLNRFRLALKRGFYLLAQKNPTADDKQSILQNTKHRYNRLMRLLGFAERIQHADKYTRQGYRFYNLSDKKLKAEAQRRFHKKAVVYPNGHAITTILAVGQLSMAMGAVFLVITNPVSSLLVALLVGTAALLGTLLMVNRNTRKTLMQLFYDFDFTAGLSKQFKDPWHQALIFLLMLGFLVLSISTGFSVGIAMFASALLLPIGLPFISGTAAVIIGIITGITATISYSCFLYVRFVNMTKRLVAFVKEWRKGPSLNTRWQQFQNQPLEQKIETLLRYGLMALLLPLVIVVSVLVIAASLSILNGMAFDFFNITLSLSTALSSQLANGLVYGFNILSTTIFIFESLYDSIVGGANVLASGIMSVAQYVKTCFQEKPAQTEPAMGFKETAQRYWEYSKKNPWLAVKSVGTLIGFALIIGLAFVNALGTGIYGMVGAPIIMKLGTLVGLRIGKAVSSFLAFMPAAAISVGAMAAETRPLYQKQMPLMIPGCLSHRYESILSEEPTIEEPTSQEVWEKRHEQGFPKAAYTRMTR